MSTVVGTPYYIAPEVIKAEKFVFFFLVKYLRSSCANKPPGAQHVALRCAGVNHRVLCCFSFFLSRYGLQCDIWSLGIILFMLLTGIPPVSGDTDAELLMNVRNGELSLENQWTPDWATVSLVAVVSNSWFTAIDFRQTDAVHPKSRFVVIACLVAPDA